MCKPIHVLISEDENLNFILLKKLLEKLYNNIIINHAVNGKQATEICDETVDLVLMDIEMPVMNGFEASEIIKKKHPNIPIIIQSAHCSQAHKEKAEVIGCNAFLPKPIVRKDFEALLSLYISEVA